MRRHDNECALAVAAAAVRLVVHLLPEDEQKGFFGKVFDAAKAALIRRDELIARERKRLGRPEANQDPSNTVEVLADEPL